MRTVTFSDPLVAAHVGKSYVAAWHNRGEGFHNCEKQTEKHIFDSSGEAYSTKNICTFFLTPDKQVVHYLSGYYAPDLFLEIAKVVDRIPRDNAEAFRDRHGVCAELMAKLAKEVRDAQGKDSEEEGREIERHFGPVPKDDPGQKILSRYRQTKYDGKRHVHSRQCLHSLGEAFGYLERVHQAFAKDGLVPLEKVRYEYLWGNPFSEERNRTPTGRGRRGDE